MKDAGGLIGLPRELRTRVTHTPQHAGDILQEQERSNPALGPVIGSGGFFFNIETKNFTVICLF
jgi:hypothetical protein